MSDQESAPKPHESGGEGAGAVTVQDVPQASRYEVLVAGQRAGLAAYERTERAVALTHTEVDDGHEGQGLAGRLAQRAMDDAREQGRAVLPFCSYMAHWLAGHPAYQDLVPADRRAEFGL